MIKFVERFLSGRKQRPYDVQGSRENFPYKVQVIRSQNRSKTISAKLVNDTMIVYAPAAISGEKLNKFIDKFSKGFQKIRLKKELNITHDLKTVAENLNRRYFAGCLNIQSIEYVTSQDKMFGVCDHRAGKIRISHYLTQMPVWVRDYVIIHEMAHLIEPNHGKSFWDIVAKYKLAERAKGYLMAKGFDIDEDAADIQETGVAGQS